MGFRGCECDDAWCWCCRRLGFPGWEGEGWVSDVLGPASGKWLPRRVEVGDVRAVSMRKVFDFYSREFRFIDEVCVCAASSLRGILSV